MCAPHIGNFGSMDILAPDGCALAWDAVDLWERLMAALLRELEAVELWERLAAALLREFARDARFWRRRIRWAQLHDAASGGYHLQ